MPDFRVSDGRSEDPRLREAGLPAFGLWSAAGAVAMRDGTDGWIPAYFVRGWPGGTAAAKKLVEAGLWSKHQLGSRDGYLFNQTEWLAEQRLASEIARDRELAAERARRSRQSRKDRELRQSGQLATGLVGIDGGPHEEPAVTPPVTRDARRTSPPNVTHDVTTERHGERALLPPPPPLPSSGCVEEEGSRSEREVTAPTPSAPSSERSYPQGTGRSTRITDRRVSHANLAALSRRELSELDQRCDVHAEVDPGGYTPPCTDCARRRRAIVAALDDATRTEQEATVAASARRRDCPSCDEYGWQLGDDGTSCEPPVHCEHLAAGGPPASAPPRRAVR